MRLAASNRLRQPIDGHFFDGRRCRARAPRRHILVQHAGQQVSGSSDGLAGSQNIAEKARTRGPGGFYHFSQVVEGGRANPFFGERLDEKSERLFTGNVWEAGEVVQLGEQAKRQFRDSLIDGAIFL